MPILLQDALLAFTTVLPAVAGVGLMQFDKVISGGNVMFANPTGFWFITLII